MSAVNSANDQAAQIQWLVDREAIRDLVSSFGVIIDEKGQAPYAFNFAVGGVPESAFAQCKHRATIAAIKSMPWQCSNQHQLTNILIDLVGNRASTHATRHDVCVRF